MIKINIETFKNESKEIVNQYKRCINTLDMFTKKKGHDVTNVDQQLLAELHHIRDKGIDTSVEGQYRTIVLDEHQFKAFIASKYRTYALLLKEAIKIESCSQLK